MNCPKCGHRLDIKKIYSRIGATGGKASAAAMTKAERSARALKASLAAAEARRKTKSS